MDESIHARQDFYERTKVCDAHDFAGVDVSDDRGFAKCLHALLCDLRAYAICRSNVNGAIFLDINFSASLFLQGANVLPARSDQRTDLVHRNSHSDDPRRMWLQFC